MCTLQRFNDSDIRALYALCNGLTINRFKHEGCMCTLQHFNDSSTNREHNKCFEHFWKSADLYEHITSLARRFQYLTRIIKFWFCFHPKSTMQCESRIRGNTRAHINLHISSITLFHKIKFTCQNYIHEPMHTHFKFQSSISPAPVHAYIRLATKLLCNEEKSVLSVAC